ncbi:MAG TPA: biotin-dependent carboxyltransferase family protein [Nocardioides sp.]|nr:biotin-dependent carboxyltransferase family protein [Nocardioides sp.]
MAELVVHAVGGPVLVQDAGRPGHAAIGVGSSGAADRASYELGNRLVGNRPGAAALEVVLGGLEVEVTATTWFVVTGAPTPIDVGGRQEPAGVVLAVRPGERVRLGTPATGLRSYLTVRGGIDAPAVLGSTARDTLAGIGRAPLSAGDRLRIGHAVDGDILTEGLPAPGYSDHPVLRVVRGPRADWIADPDVLTRTRWTVGKASDRVGLRLTGAHLQLTDPTRQLPSEGATRGAIQVPPSGEPIVFGPDHPVTGGYPVVGVVIEKDTDRLAQLRPGETVGFRWV